MPGQVAAAVNGWLTGLVTSAATPTAALVGELLDVRRLAGVERLRAVWSASRDVANGLFVVLIVLGGMLVMTYGSVHTRWAAKEIAPRVVVAFLAVNTSWWVITTALHLALATAVAVAGEGLSPGQVLGGLLVNTLSGGPGFMVLLDVVIVVLAAVLVVSLVVFGAVFMLLIVAAPLALCTHALPQIDWVATRWWHALFAALAVPTAHGLILALIARVLLTPGGYSVLGFATAGRLVNIMVLNALLWVMIKIPRWAWSSVTSAAGSGGRPSLIGRVVRAVIAYKTLGLLGGAAGAAGWAGVAGNTSRRLPGALRSFAGAARQRGASSGTPGMATSGANRAGAGVDVGAATRLAAVGRARERARPRLASGVGAVSFLAPGPAEPTRYRPTRTVARPGGDPGPGVRPASFVEPIAAQPQTVDRARERGGMPTVVPVFQAPAPNGGSGTSTRRRPTAAPPAVVGAPLWSHPTTAPAPRPARPGAGPLPGPVGSTRVVFVSPSSGPAPVGARGYSGTAAPVVFSSPTRDTSTQYRPEQLRNPRFPQPPGPTPPRPTTRVGLPRHRTAGPQPANEGSGSDPKWGE